MSFFNKPAATMSDDELSAVADEEASRREALLERERRAEAKREAEEAEARRKAERERQERIAALLKEHAALGEVATMAQCALGDAIVTAGALLEKRDDALREVWRVAAGLRALGAQEVPPLSLPFAPEATAAGRRIVPFVERELTESPIASAMRANPGAFFK